MLKSDTIRLLKKYELFAKKKLGQNFLISEKALEQICKAADLQKTDNIVEIGPGLGTLTSLLIKKCQKVTAIELDRDMTNILAAEYGEKNSLEIINADALKWTPPLWPYKLVANIPYYITSPLISHFLIREEGRPDLIVLLMQKEVAQKICARPGDLSVLALRVQIFGQPTLIATVKAGAFHPMPKVDSAILKIKPFPKPLIQSTSLKTAFHLIESAFSQKRKKMRTSLKKVLPGEKIDELLLSSGLTPNARPQELSIEQWATLSTNCHFF